MSKPSWIGYELGGRYRIESLLGAGGMSSVYRAVDPNLRRTVAIKLIHSHLSADAGFVRRFEQEAAAVAQLSHPNIVQVYDFNHDDDTYYMVLEYLPGETLQERLEAYEAEGRQMDPQEAVDITLAVTDAVAYAHEREMIHRDIKPANVMLKDDGRVILMDFGIAKILGGGNTLTGTGAVIGTVQYMAPELVQGEAADARSDIYALGVMLYEMLSGKPPFNADSAMTTMLMHINEPVPNLREARPDAPPHLVAVVDRCLLKEPDARYQTAGDLTAGLRGEPTGAHTIARQPTPADSPHTEPVPTVVPPRPETGAEPIPPAQPPQPQQAQAKQRMVDAKKKKRKAPVGLLIGGGLVAFALVAGILLLVALFGPGAASSATGSATPTSESDGAVDGDDATEQPISGTSNECLAPPCARITGVSVTETTNGEAYLIEFETTGFEPAEGARHVHFHWDIFEDEEAGAGGTGMYQIHYDSEPAAPYLVSDRPAEATQMCVVVANADHTPVPGSGNCFDLPGDSTASSGPTPTPTLTPTATPRPEPYVVINDIVIDQFGHYSVDYEVVGFEEEGTGTSGVGQHVHFFWSTVPPEQAGNPGSGPWSLYYGPAPFRNLLPGGRPADARQMCALIANPDHSVIAGSGECFPLPDVSQAPDEPFAQITGIEVGIYDEYTITYEVFGFEEEGTGSEGEGQHVAFYWDSDPDTLIDWWGGDVPLDDLTTENRPTGAQAICITVVGDDGTPLDDSGTCYGLPDVEGAPAPTIYPTPGS
ncbi:MAG: serine/threonine protein kinase [Chloroflexi bacterium]|nr:serine/threonine protein kinase [Chloroflexota bacterium]